MESRKRPLLGLVLISGSYCLGVAALIVAMFFNREQVGVQIANVHGVPALAGFPILILACIVGALVAIGLYKMTSWGYWLTLIYVCYLLVIPPILVGKVPSLIGNITWPLTVAVYLVIRRKQYFGIHQSTEQGAAVGLVIGTSIDEQRYREADSARESEPETRD